MRRIAVGMVLVALAAGLVGCAEDTVTDQYLAGSNQGYIGSDGVQYDEIEPDDRGDPVTWSGETEDGDALSSDDVAGKVVVVNFWYAGCAPCRAEAADLEATWQSYQDQNVQFVGVNTSDQADTAASFEKKYGVTYPSIIDVNDGTMKLAFAGAIPIDATPSTIILDASGRVAVRIIGRIESQSILDTLISDTLKEKASA
ncbi:MAG: TlpA disulfide reductase family protein [Microbacterium sp.]